MASVGNKRGHAIDIRGVGVVVEAFVLDFDGDIYGDDVSCAFLARIRPQERFDSAAELVAQMRVDVSKVDLILAKSVPPAAP